MPYTWKRKNRKVFLHSYKQNDIQSKTMANPETHIVGSSVQEELSFHSEWFPSLKIISKGRYQKSIAFLKIRTLNHVIYSTNIKSENVVLAFADTRNFTKEKRQRQKLKRRKIKERNSYMYITYFICLIIMFIRLLRE